jgi:hypothetical protein
MLRWSSLLVNLLTTACEFLAARDQPAPCDLIFVLAGRDERKPYGLKLFGEGLAPQLILSVGRFEIRHTAQNLAQPELLRLRDETTPAKRHFWIHFRAREVRIVRANLRETNTFWELHGLGDYAGPGISSIVVISTSVHLRRIRFCCRQIPFFRDKRVLFVPVPEEASSFRQDGWWKRPDHWWYVLSEYVKLAGYQLLYRS